MRMLIRYQSGFRAEAVLLAANSDRMRVAIGSQRDTVELHKSGGGLAHPERGGHRNRGADPDSGNRVFALLCRECRPGPYKHALGATC
jgi:hypothetical protein